MNGTKRPDAHQLRGDVSNSLLPEQLWPANVSVDYFEVRDGAKLRWLHSEIPGNAHGTIIVLPGRTEFIEKYFEVAGELWQRQFSFAILDFRGQGLSSRPLKSQHKHHMDSVDILVDDLHEFVALLEKRALPRPFIILAHSMGGHVALRYLGERETPVAAAVVTAPLVDIRFGAIPRPVAIAMMKIAHATGRAHSYALGQGDYGSRSQGPDSMALLTSDPERFVREHKLIAQNPNLALGGVTWGWLRAVRSSCRRMRRSHLAKKIAIPVLAVQAGRERLVDNDAMARFVSELPHGRLVVIAEARHEILQERDSIRARFWQAFDRFIQDFIGADHGRGSDSTKTSSPAE